MQTFAPTVTVEIWKNIGMSSAGPGAVASQRYVGASRYLNLTPYLSDNGSITVQKSIRECYGTAVVTLADQMITQRSERAGTQVQSDTLARLLQPLDVIEIRASREPHKYAGSKLPLLFRGIIRGIGRHEHMGEDGHPQRLVVIQAGDCGVLADLTRSNLIPGAPGSENVQDEFAFYSTWFPKADDAISASDFVTGCVTNILNPQITVMTAAAELTNGTAVAASAGIAGPSPLRTITPVSLVESGTVFLPGVDARWGGNNLWGLLQQYGDCAIGLNELFFQTIGAPGQEKDFLVFRPLPAVDTDGGYILAPYTSSSGTAVAGYPQVFTVTDHELVELATQRDDSKTVNFIYVMPSWLSAAGETSVIQNAWATLSGENVISDQNSSSALYGFRPIFLNSQEGPRVGGQTADEYRSAVQTAMAELKQKITDLKSINAQNIVFESGRMVIRGRPDIVPGNYVKLLRGVAQSKEGRSIGAFVQQMYVVAVSHEILPFRSWTQSLQFERGTGFISAVEDGQSPYLREMAGGVAGVYGIGSALAATATPTVPPSSSAPSGSVNLGQPFIEGQ